MVPAVVAPFREPTHRFGPGHRGVDLAAHYGFNTAWGLLGAGTRWNLDTNWTYVDELTFTVGAPVTTCPRTIAAPSAAWELLSPVHYDTQGAVIMKLGRNLPKVRAALREAGRLEGAEYGNFRNGRPETGMPVEIEMHVERLPRRFEQRRRRRFGWRVKGESG